METVGPPTPPDPMGLTRGFLFADLRGYTSFLEQRGASDASRLLGRYRALVRAAVNGYTGAEVRTEGDSFYVVFPNASSAVACGLAILEAAAEATRSDPALPVHVGIGVHAGETVENDEGFVGTAVNLAARLCAAASAGQLLVSDTVRALTAGIAPVRYEPAGRRRLKGIREPIAVFSAVRDSAPVTRRHQDVLQNVAAAAAVTAGLVVVALVGGAVIRVGLGGTELEQSPTPGSSDNASVVSGLPLGTVLPGGRYRANFDPPFTIAAPPGSTLYLDEADAFAIHDGQAFLMIAHLQVVYRGQCRSSGTEPIGNDASAILNWMQEHPYLDLVRDPYPVTIGGERALEVQLDVSLEVEPCPDDPIPGAPPTVYLFPTAEEPYGVLPSSRITAWLVTHDEVVISAFTDGNEDLSGLPDAARTLGFGEP